MTGNEFGVALLRRDIGRRFKILRVRAGLTQEQAAAELQRSRSTLVRLEDGDPRIRFRDSDVLAMLKLYQAGPEDRGVLLGLTTETRNGHKSWWHDHTATALPPWFGLYVSLEDSAETIRKYESELITGLLQTPAYAREVTSVMTGYLTPEEIERRIIVRRERQSLLSRPRAPHLNVILGEAILHRPIGGPALMSEQLRHLLKITRHGNVRLRIVPYAAGVHGGMAVGGGFSMLDFPADPISGQPLEPPLVYVDSLTGAMYLTKPVEVSAYALAWDSLEAKALDENTSREMITNVLEGLSHA